MIIFFLYNGFHHSDLLRLSFLTYDQSIHLQKGHQKGITGGFHKVLMLKNKNN
jgi:hypothetical protein